MKRRLNACQIYIFLLPSANLNAQEIKIVENKLFVSSTETPIFLPFNIVPGTLSGLVYKDNVVTFRTRFMNNLSENRVSIVHLSETGFFKELKKLQVGDRVSLSCSQCGFEILKNDVTLRYVSYEGEEIFDTSDMFCHGNKKTSSNTVELPEGVRLIYENGSIIVSPFDADNMKWTNKGVISCIRCLNWLGIAKNENAVQFWIDSVKILDFFQDCTQQDVATQIFFSVLEKTITSCLFPICNIMLVCKVSDFEESRLLLTVMDRNVFIYEYNYQEDSPKFREIIFVKILFKELGADEQDESNIHGLIYVSKSTLCAALHELYSSAKEIPHFDTEEKIAYLRIK